MNATTNLAQYKDTFLSEAKDHVAAMNNALLKLEKAPSNPGPVNDLFRAAHTLKSMAAAMQYEKTAALCHAMEDVLDAVKKGRAKPGRCVDLLFTCCDNLESTLKNIREDKGEMDAGQLTERLRVLASDGEAGVPETEEIREEEAVARVQSIEVKVERLDLLMRQVEELLINKMRLERIREDLNNPELSAALDSLARVVREIQYTIMQARLVPIGFVFNRFPRMVRDLAKQQNKEVTLEVEGSDIELDRSVIDEIGESLVHLIRNAVDHGVELPEVRRKSGKQPSAVLRLSARQTKSSALIKVSDDGAGLDLNDIRNAAVKRGILSAEANDEAAVNSIFSGVSTTREVTAVSGRGFGLGIVKNKIESIGGEIRVKSEPHKGTTFTIAIPLTLAIIKSLFVGVGGKTYAIPLVNIERLLIVDQGNIKGMADYEAVVLNEEDIPLARLSDLFGAPRPKLKKQPVVVVWKGREKMGLAVDNFTTTHEIVLKPLSKLVRENRYFSGSTVTGSGEVVLILDVANLILSKRRYESGVTATRSHAERRWAYV